MYQVIKNEKDLQKWLALHEDSVLNTHLGVLRALKHAVRTLDAYYGKTRNLVGDWGGFVLLLFGSDFEIDKHFQNVMEYFKLNADEYEYEDKYLEPKRSAEVTFRLYLCSSDYSILIVTVKER